MRLYRCWLAPCLSRLSLRHADQSSPQHRKVCVAVSVTSCAGGGRDAGNRSIFPRVFFLFFLFVPRLLARNSITQLRYGMSCIATYITNRIESRLLLCLLWRGFFNSCPISQEFSWKRLMPSQQRCDRCSMPRRTWWCRQRRRTTS